MSNNLYNKKLEPNNLKQNSMRKDNKKLIKSQTETDKEKEKDKKIEM